MSHKGTIFDIKKFAIHDGPGIRTTVFLKGCPMDCWWCHNPEARDDITGRLAEKTRTISVNEITTEILKDRVFYDQSGGGATFSGGEPLAQPEFLQALLESCRAHGIHTAVDTCGYAPTEDFEKICDHTELFLYDLKIMNDEQHQKYTGVSNELVLKNLSLLAKKGSKVHVRVPLIPGITDSAENLDAIVEFTGKLPGVNHVSLLPYNRFGEDKRNRFKLSDRLGRLPSQTKEQVEAAAARFVSEGYEVKIGG
jgi:pyruvate formate lyase activating enzyme